ncbi:precorrin-3B synthase [Paractinoplanes atraurantiacus]|uniref:Precorrin-3B synthase n=1 Tax=Paractinoplanes atraurantiacus TaxID=1036182 RepID=A0A285IQD0_9ACTN|nr:precorrin-3B synthase [Actinoplanes atraurantiacus]SNY50198.1 precorrin-3B synthase [Actinoplanes atraurantiacus]
MPPPIRRTKVDACPGALRLHSAADGPLARVRLPGGMLTGAQLAALGEIGPLELTSRANLQLRALNDIDPTALAARLSAAGLLPSSTHETVRNIAAPPLADATLRTLVTGLDRALCADPVLAALPGRFLFALGDVPLTADLAAVPASADHIGTAPDGATRADHIGAAPDGATFAILLAGHDVGLRVPAAAVVETLLAAARAFLEERADVTAWRLHEMPDGPARVATKIGAPGTPEPVTRTPAPTALGLLDQPGGLVAVSALVPLGMLGGEALHLLTTARRLVVTPARGIVVPDLAPEDARRWQRRLEEAGLPTTAGSRWTGVTACAGRPGCAKSLADVRADAAATSTYAEGLPVHWIGCARGCGSPSGPHVRVEATPAGYAVTRQPTGETFDAIASARRI